MSHGGLNPAQAWALTVLERKDEWVRAHDGPTSLWPKVFVNRKDAASLADRGLALSSLGAVPKQEGSVVMSGTYPPYTSSRYELVTVYRVTDEGRGIVP